MANLGEVSLAEIQVTKEVSKWTQINLQLPKLTMRMWDNIQGKSVKALTLIPILVFNLTGFEMYLSSKTYPDEVDIKLYLASIGVWDPRATLSVKQINNDLPKDVKVNKKIIETCQDQYDLNKTVNPYTQITRKLLTLDFKSKELPKV